MASNNNDDRRNKMQKKTQVVDRDDEDSSNDSLLALSLSAPVVVVVPSALSFGTILEEFPDFLSCVLLYIADRVIWNSITASNKDMHEKSKAIQPPWPRCYKLPLSCDCWSWSPCGTRIACSFQNNNVAIFDQRHGLLHRWRGNFDDGGYDPINDLKYSPDGRYLVSTDGTGIYVRLWDSRNYEQLQEWDTREEVGFEELTGGDSRVSFSACSKYIAVSIGTGVFLKDVENGKTIKSLMLPNAMGQIVTKSVFSSDGHAIFICCREMLQIWRPYLDADDDDRLVTIWRQTENNPGYTQCTFSHDHKMVAIYSAHNYDQGGTTGILWSIDMDRNRLTQKSNFPFCGYCH